ncbi:hypothetical protein ACFYZE_21060 [Streptomyces sp. NPDC001796]|uniref:hypothetical protein n=1 Tax=Streptomyces sp. NPDC001796 TaxID=3364609 RepID=UPI0036A9AA7A
MATAHRRPMKSRAAALLLTLLLGLGLTVTPAAAATDTLQRATAAVTTVRTGYASPHTASDLSLRHPMSRHHASPARLRTSKTRKKSGFFKKLGIFLLVIVILGILFIALLVWFLVRLVRRAFSRGGRR